jgi:hypothetical protein
MGESLYQVSHWALSRCIVWSVLTVSATCTDAVAQEPSDDSQWTFDAAVYGWLMATQGTLGLKGLDVDIDNSFADTLKASDSLMAFMVHGEAWRDDIGIFLDIAYVDLGYDDIAVGPLRANASNDLAIVEIGGLYRFGRWPIGATGQQGSWALEGLGGLRYSYIDGEIDVVGGPAVERSKDWVDPSSAFVPSLSSRRPGRFPCAATSAASVWDRTSLGNWLACSATASRCSAPMPRPWWGIGRSHRTTRAAAEPTGSNGIRRSTARFSGLISGSENILGKLRSGDGNDTGIFGRRNRFFCAGDPHP